ncbi:tyrosine-type recombinase/integrase [Lactococcus garvieae subsp. garvieae]|uniref:site-specific integrase n=1 Tax=Lactococcus garvieae TaxID=1363 RepID=UPI0005AB6DE7|nr:site-specific integrase [Lactococcus garvieae]KAA8710689.1 tyrosine-type recombinase/integrase [Lactococcus garvieae subsp. garvieae]MDG6192276.1 site-specific integrase [Lactococcus garvieae]PCR99384.1 hypothetical protein RU85_GL001135 [Lactococcus garvieae]QPR49393.1 site-specific integrase [Lactococcus garvieae]
MTVTKNKKTKKWEVDISDGFSPINGERNRHRKTGFNTKKEAEDYEANFRTFELHQVSKRQKISIEYLFSIVQHDDINNDKKMSYRITQERNYNRYLKSYFAKADMSKITYDDIIEFRNHLLSCKAKGGNGRTLSKNTVNKQILLLKKILDVAIVKGLIFSNPCKNVRKLRIDKVDMKYYTLHEFSQFINCFDKTDYPYKLIFSMLFYSGARINELLSLTWNDVNFNIGYIDIHRSIFRLKGINYYDTPKTKAGIRKIYIHKKLLDELKIWQTKQFNILHEYTDNLMNLQIFQDCPEDIYKDRVQIKKTKIYEEHPHLKKIRIHDFRHSHAALLINQGLDIFKIKERMGHETVEITYNLYGHLYPDKQKEIADLLNEISY